jgi:hypothetical protein
MRLLFCVVGSLALLLASPGHAAARCKSPSEQAAVAATVATIAADCSCCGPTSTARPLACAHHVARSAVKNDTLPEQCIARVLREARRACRGAGAACPECVHDADCDDGNACTVDTCNDGVCEHGCVCADPAGGASCCPGPAALCVKPCGLAGGVCGGSCPSGATCEAGASTAAACRCVSGEGGPCGGNVFAPPPVCAPGLVCKQANPDATGTCEPAQCIPFFQDGCSTTADCCEPCGNGRIAPCAVCLNGRCEGAP